MTRLRGAREGGAGHATPPAARWLVLGVVGVLIVGAAYLIAVRYEAILADLSNLTAWCF